MLLSNRYNVLQKLGSGGCGEVFLAEDINLPSKPKCVIKQFKPSVNDAADHQLIREKFEKEAEILEVLGHHDQIPQVYAFFEENGELYIVEQYIEGLTLTQKVAQDGVFDDNFVRDFLVCLLPVISFIHSHNIIHRDIKPDNIILRKSDGMPVLIDFGVVEDFEDTIINNQFSQTQIISRGYTAPEQASGFPNFSSDLFSLGMTAIFLLTGKNPSNLPNTKTNPARLAWQTGLSNFNLSTSDWAINRELTETINKSILDKNERFLTADEMKNAVYKGVKSQRQRFQSAMHTPYMWKVLIEPKYVIDREESATFFLPKLYEETVSDCLQNSEEYRRYLNWKVIDERGL